MQPHPKISPSTQLFISKLKIFLDSMGLTIQQFLNNFQMINLNQLSKLEFFRIVSVLNIQTYNNFQPQIVFAELSKKEDTIDVSFFKKMFAALGSLMVERKVSEEKAREDEMKKKIIKIGLHKLNEYIRQHPNPMAKLREFDADHNNSLNKNEFSSFLVSTDITEFGGREIRRMIMEQIFKYFKPRTEITMAQLAIFFKIEQKSGNQENLQKPVNPDEHDHSPIKKPEGHKNNVNQNDGFNKKKYDHPLLNPIIPKHEEHPKNQDFDHSISNCIKHFPKAMKFYRLGDPNPSEHEILQQLEDMLSKNKQYVDNNNPKTEGEYIHACDIFNTNTFYIFQMAASVLIRERSRIGVAREIEPKDIIQGSVGDCYFLSSIASIISIYPELIAERFLLNVNPVGFYAVKLFIDGEWKIIQTDDRFPCKGKTPLYAKPHSNQIWVMLLQKCWAKTFGSFKEIGAGSSKEGFIALTGAPVQLIPHDKETEELQLLRQLQLAQKNRYVATMSGSKYLQSLGQKGQQQLGLIGGHAYSLLKIIKFDGITLVKLRNPWGKTIWKGDWSFQSKLWTKQLRDKYNYHRSPEDGSFYMHWKDYCRYFGEVVICKLNPTYMHESIRIKTNRHKSVYLQMKVKTAGQYIISIYQESKRKYCNQKGYEYSQARLIILQKKGQDLVYVGARSTSQAQVCNVDIQMQQGDYLISAKVVWKNWTDHQLVVTSYGVDHTTITPVKRTIAPIFKQNLIRSYCSKFAGTGKIKAYDKYGFDATCQTNFNMETGIGFLRMKNNGDKGFESTQEMIIKGLKVIKPDRLPLNFKVTNKFERVVGFFVNPSGYQYSNTEKVKY